MYPLEIFKQAMPADKYTIDRVKYTDHSHEVRKIEGRVLIPKRVSVNGVVRTVMTQKAFRWDATGHCFSIHSNVRQRKYDLRLKDYI